MPTPPHHLTAWQIWHRLLPIAIHCTLVATAGCKLSSTVIPEEPYGSNSGPARQVFAAGRIFQLGSDSPLAAPEEKPGRVLFQHDFWLDTTEVTQAEFQQLLGWNPSPSGFRGQRNPVVNVSWFDAILFCNARSNKDGLDSVYTYSAVVRDSSGSAQSMEGLTSRFDRQGWRLPSEAEWEFAASAGTERIYPWGAAGDSAQAPECAWFNLNSGSRIHPVASLKPNALQLYDMSGNVMEWVQDWKAPFPTVLVSDYAGPEGPLDVAEIPIKGGSFNYGRSQLRIASRSATYAAFRASRSEFVGFRCARGGYLARRMDRTGRISALPPVSIPMGNLTGMLGTDAAKLVFVNRTNGKGTLSWIDFGESTPTARALPDTEAVFHPEISPDGSWVAWCTAMEGSNQPSRVKARRLRNGDSTIVDLGPGAIPRWWTEGSDTFLIRATSAEDNTSETWGQSETRARKWNGNGQFDGIDHKWSGGSFHDGRSGHFLYSGYRRLRQFDMLSAASKTLFTSPSNGKSNEDTSQVCNVSSAPDGSGKVLFLDFGASTKSVIIGRPYGIHEIAFLADSVGKVLSFFTAPSDRRNWEHLEWSNAPRWATAIAQNSSGANQEIRLLDLETGRSQVLSISDEVWMPKLWIGKQIRRVDSSARFDSAGLWNTPELGVTVDFSHKASRFWRLRDQLDYVLLGSSRVRYGLNPQSIKSGLTLNWGLDGGEFYTAKNVLEDYILPHTPRLKGVVMSIEPGWWFKFTQQAWPAVASTVGYRFDANHGFWKAGIPSGYLEAVAGRKLPIRNFDSLGGDIHPVSQFGWGSTECHPPATEDMDAEPFASNWNDLETSIRSLESRRIHLVLLNFPQNPLYRNVPECMGRYGPSWSTWRILQQRLRSLEAAHPYFHFYDANLDGMHGYPWNFFLDADHLADSGAIRLSTSLDSVLRSLDSR